MSETIRPRLTSDEMDVVLLYRAGELDLDLNEEKHAGDLAKKLQRARDVSRIERKAWREHTRISNALEEYNRELLNVIGDIGKSIKTVAHKQPGNNPVLILQLSDLHLNELVNVKSNKYDFYVASSRLKLLADEVIQMGKHHDTQKLVIAVLGDLLNSDRRLDELMSASTNRAPASALASWNLRLNQYFDIDMAGVTGNEARAKQEIGFSDVLATDNYDFTIYDTLRIMLQDKEGFTFSMMQPNEALLEIHGKNFLLIHGHQLGSSGDMQKKIQEIMGRFKRYGIEIHYVLSGHIHSAYVSDYFARNSSLVGSNAYSEEALNYVSVASQNVHLVYQSGRINSTRIDLQDAYDYKGYPMEEHIEAYNAKSANKARPEHTIMKVVI